MSSFKTPTQQQLETVLQRMRSPDFTAYFLSRLNNPKWIEVLQDKGLFSSPPPAIRVEGGSIQYPRWPASKYLARMAAQAPNEVAAIFAQLGTDNPSIIGDVLDASLAMPANVSIVLVPIICRAVQEGTLWTHFDEASDLCVRLTEGSQLDAAMSLADALFTPTFEEGQDELSQRHRDEYWYKEGLTKVVPALATARARAFLPKLCDWLKAAIEAKQRVDPGSGVDYSGIWRPAIEDHEQNHDYEFAGVMVGFVRQGFEQAIRSGCLSLNEALLVVMRHKYLVFRRLRLHLIGEFAEQSPDLARQTMLDRALFEDYGCKHEHAMLMGKRFDMLHPDQQAEWLRWVREGPTGKLAKVIDESDDLDMNQRRRDYWRFERFHWIRSHLTGEERAFYQDMHAKCGEPDMADLNVRMEPVRCGPVSPMTVEFLGRMTFDQVVDTVSSWKPEKPQFMGPDVEGLVSTFGKYVASDPEQFSRKASLLIARPASFVREFIAQMGEAVRGGHSIDLGALLNLCHWVVSRPVEERTTPEQERDVLIDKDWQWTRDRISEFLTEVCKARTDDKPRFLPGDSRQVIWNLIESLCHDRAASYIVQDGAQDDPRVRDYLDLGIKSPRGKAIHAALEYAQWVADEIKQSDGKREVIPGGFEAMPEVRAMLEWQIADGNRSFEAMSVIGSLAWLLYRIDKQWLVTNAARLFRLDEIEQTPSGAHGWAAWNVFLTWTEPHIEYYTIFKSQFMYAVDQAAKVELPERGDERPMHHLGEHLMILYARGQLGLDDDESLLRRFLANSNPSIRRHAIFFIGRTLKSDKDVPPEVIERLMTLWDFYWAGPGKGDAREKPHSVLFGIWFSSGRLPDQWALDRLEDYVQVVPTPGADRRIAERLAGIAHVDIAKSVRILDRMVRGDPEGWQIEIWPDSAKEILRQAMRSPGETRERAETLINYLGRRGYTDFGQILKEVD